MHQDVCALRDFYYTTSLGRAAQRAMRDRLIAFWPSVRGLNVAGFGFAAPLLRPCLADAERVIALMPAQQGVMHWPAEAANHSTLVEETNWPLASDSIDRLVILHGLETSERPGPLLEEAARVLRPGGKVVLIVPNRSGLWARRDGTPFALGRPYSLGQIEALLREHGFEVGEHSAALFFPPKDRRAWLNWAMMLENIGQRVSRYHAGGVLLVDATRIDQTPRASGLRVRERKPLRILDPVRPSTARPAWRESDHRRG
ncbi:MAG: methyltransferase domain-containing protein [Rhodobacteraceae bacterium]|nr:MAG: methyltransferase domain-containing protein [Paracoccaceae bacterium]